MGDDQAYKGDEPGIGDNGSSQKRGQDQEDQANPGDIHPQPGGDVIAQGEDIKPLGQEGGNEKGNDDHDKGNGNLTIGHSGETADQEGIDIDQKVTV